jgi:23S rRNA pseudouridine2605 synthase
MPHAPIRLQRLLAACGAASSRRHAEELLLSGKVTLVGACGAGPATPQALGASLLAADVHRLRVGGQPLPPLSPSSPLLGGAPRLFAFHKPRGYLTAWRDASRATLSDALHLRGAPPAAPRLIHAGRLDFDSEGLLLLATCGDLALRIAHPSLGCAKRYLAVAVPHGRRPGDGGGLAAGALPGALEAGVLLRPAAAGGGGGGADWAAEDPRPVAASSAALLEWGAAEAAFARCGAGALGAPPQRGAAAVSLTLSDGRKRVVRRAFDALGWRVERLLRVAVGSVELGALPAGGWVEVAPSNFRARSDLA